MFHTPPIRLKESCLYWALYLWTGNVILRWLLLNKKTFSWTLASPTYVDALGAGTLDLLTKGIPDFGVRIGWNTAWQPGIIKTRFQSWKCLKESKDSVLIMGMGETHHQPLLLYIKEPCKEPATILESFTQKNTLESTAKPSHRGSPVRNCSYKPTSCLSGHPSKLPFLLRINQRQRFSNTGSQC